MSEFPKLLNLAPTITRLEDSTKGFSIRNFLLDRGFTSDYLIGDYVVTDDWDGMSSNPLKVMDIDEGTCIVIQLRGAGAAGDWWCPGSHFLKVPEEYLVWSDGKNNKPTPLNCESLSIEGLKDPMLEREGLCQEIPLPLAEDVEYVTCTNNTGVGGCLTIGKEYKVVDRYVHPTGSDFITIIDDNGLENGCYASRFVAKEDKGKDRCNFNFNIKGASVESFRSAALKIRAGMEAESPFTDRLSEYPIEALHYLKKISTSYVVCPTTGRKLDPNTLIPLDEVVTFTDKPII